MTDERSIPDDPLAFIRDCVRRGQIYWTYHVNMRLAGRSLSRQVILDAVDGYEIIESYPQDKYLPSYLVLARAGQDAFHVLCAADVEENNVRVVTAYRPDPAEWEPGMRTRRTRS
jgi:hypothetical protein